MNPAIAYVGDYTYSLDDLASSAKKRYLIAVQSGKPVLDSEMSELGYRNLDFMRRYLERNISDAVIDGDRTAVSESDLVPGRTWRVEESAISNVNNFVVKGGTQEKPAVLVIKGYPILLFSDIEYNQQNNSGSLEDDDFTNTSIPALNPPGAGTRTDTVYVDFYLAEVSSESGSEYQDVTIKNTNLNLQTANRFRFVQDILVAAGTTSIPVDGFDSNNVYHRYYKLAEITRIAGDNTITTANIVDKRTYVNSLENLSNGKGELNVFNAFIQNDLTVHGTMTIINQTETNQEKLVITCNDPGVDSLAINKTQSGRALVINKEDSGYAIDLTDTGSDDAIIIDKTGSGYAINVQNGSILLDNDTDLFYSPAIEGVNSLKTHISNQLVLSEPTGFPNKTDSIFSFSNATRQFTISPTGSNFSFYINNTKYTRSSAESIIITNTEGVWFIYYDHSGVLTASQIPWDVTQHVLIAYLYWDATNAQAIILAEERHGTVMDGKTHEYLHRTIGTRYYSGLALSASTSGNGNSNADAQISMSNGTIYDEDNVINITDGITSDFFVQELSPIANIPIFYRSGASGFWRKKTATQYPVYDDTTGTIFYNSFGASWGLTKATDAYFVPMFIFATNDINDPVIAILGQSQHNTFLDAQTNSSYQALAFGAMPFQEMKILFRVIFQTSNSYTNAVRANLVDIQDLRSVTNVPSATYVPTDHGSLSGLSDQDHPATAIFTSFTNFNGMLTAVDTDVQKALDTLDDIWIRTGAGTSNSVDMYRTGDVIIGTNSTSADAKLLVADTLGNNHRTRIQALGTPTAINQLGGQILLAVDIRDVVISSIVETAIGSETWAAAPRVGIQIKTCSPSGAVDALRITYDGRFGFGSTTVTAGFRAQVEGALHVTGDERVDGTATFNGNINLSTQTADRIALIDSSKNIVSSTVTLAELQVLDDFVENVQDIVGGMVSSNTENGIVVTYDDASGKLNFDVNDPVITITGGVSGSGTLTNLGNLTITVSLNTEDVQDIVGDMVSGNTENGIVVTYDDASGKLNFDVNDPTITLSGDVSGSAVMTNLGNTTISVSLNSESVQDIVSTLITNGIKSGIAVTYDDTNNRINFDVNDPTITLSGDVSGSAVMTNLTDTTIVVTVLDDSHIHDTRYYTKTESDNRFLTITNTLYNISDSWFRSNNDAANVKLYGNSRQMVFRTDGDTAYGSDTASPFIWMYGGDGYDNRLMLVTSDGRLWVKSYGYLDNYFAVDKVNQLGNHVFAESDGLRIQINHSENYGGRLYFGDQQYVYLAEDFDDQLLIQASNGVTINPDLTVNNNLYVNSYIYGELIGNASTASLTNQLGNHVFAESDGLRIQINHSENYGGRLYFGDSNRVYLAENLNDNVLNIYANGVKIQSDLYVSDRVRFPNDINFVSTVGGDPRLYLESNQTIFMQFGPDLIAPRAFLDASYGFSATNATNITYRLDGSHSTSIFATINSIYVTCVYKCVLLNVGTTSKRSVFLINETASDSPTSIEKLMIGIIGGEVGQVIHIINTNLHTSINLQSRSIGGIFREIKITPGNSVQLIKLTNDSADFSTRVFPAVNFHPVFASYTSGFYSSSDSNMWQVLSISDSQHDTLNEVSLLPSS